MKMKANQKTIAMAVTAAMAASMFVPAFATESDTSTNTTTDSSSATSTTVKAPMDRGHHGMGADRFANVVKQGIITQEQAAAIIKSLEADRPASPMAKLVTVGTISQAQLDAIEAALKANRPERGPRHEAGTASTNTSNTASSTTAATSATAHKTPQEVIAALVTDGTITQAQADVILKNMPQPPANGEKSAGFKGGRMKGIKVPTSTTGTTPTTTTTSTTTTE